jgi:MerR family transcriptional regulator, mercuric resistance operon regulatory protein
MQEAFKGGEGVMRSGELMIGALAERVGVNIETVRYYERVGLLPAAARTRGGHRLYDASHVRRLTFIRRSRELGFSLDEVRSLLKLVDGRRTCGEVKAVAIDHVARIRERIAELRRMERILIETAARCEGGGAPSCAIVETLSGEARA